MDVGADVNNGICQSREDKTILVGSQGIGNPKALVKKQDKPAPDGLTTNKVNSAHANYSQHPRPILHYPGGGGARGEEEEGAMEG